MVPFGVVNVRNEYSASWEWNSGSNDSDSWSENTYVLCPLMTSAYVDTLSSTVITYNDNTEWTNWISAVCNCANMQMYANDISGRYEVTDYTYQRRRICTIEPPMWVFWIGHMMYCSLDDVNIN